MISCILVLAVGSGEAAAIRSSLRVEVTVAEAFSDGPVVVSVKWSNQGSRSILCLQPICQPELWLDRSLSLDAPSTWARRQFPIALNAASTGGACWSPQTLSKGQALQKLFFIHHLFSTIPQGRHVVKMRLKLTTVVGTRAIVISSLHVVEFNTAALTDVSARQLAGRLTDAISATDSTGLLAVQAVETLRFSRHPELLLLACRMLDRSSVGINSDYTTGMIAEAIRYNIESLPARNVILDNLCSPFPQGTILLFRYVINSRTCTELDFAKLDKASALWVRLLSWIARSDDQAALPQSL